MIVVIITFMLTRIINRLGFPSTDHTYIRIFCSPFIATIIIRKENKQH